MLNKLEKIFKKKDRIIIGVIHLPPLLGYPNFPGFDVAIKNALLDLKALEDGGVDGIIIENNYDVPHKHYVSPEVAASMFFLSEKIKNSTKLPVGISVLWNDYKAALAIAKTLDLKFVRIPVFVDTVETKYGIMQENSKDIISFQKKIKAKNIALFTDIHVKHSKIVSKYTITESAKLAIKNRSDSLIITGNWTGEAPNIKDLANVRKTVDNFPIICGSGVDKKNIAELFKYTNGAIVGTSLKNGIKQKKEINVKSYSQRINIEKVKELIKKAK